MNKMNKTNQIVLSVGLLILGVMIAIHFKSPQEQELRETRDMWDIRLQLQEEQERQQNLNNELNELKSIQTQYQSASEEEQIIALNDSIDVLKEKIGLTEINEAGIFIKISPIDNDVTSDFFSSEFTTELLHRLINELNSYGATHIAVNNERLTELTAIRQVGDQIYMNQRPIGAIPLIIKATSNDPDRLYSYMEVSQAQNEFAIHNIDFELRKTKDVTIPAYDGDLSLEYVTIIDDEAGGS